ncbi:MAG: hypothetical protein KJO95_06040 [Gammaproteobacteria bacterium]|nr:hypothetical protein [Woeseia sp.]MBT8102511.1 hypothetical protein [Gammaproteobacteria bacterium]
MKNKVLLGMPIVLSFLLACGPTDSGQAQESDQNPADTNVAGNPESAERARPNGKGHSKGNPNRRTWVVYDYDPLEQEHMWIGDAFRIQKTGGTYKLKAFQLLRDRWGKPNNFMLDLVEGDDDLLCGHVVIDDHSDDENHVFKFELLSDQKLDVHVEIYDATKSLEEQCTLSGPIHGGRAHAEN